VNAPLAQVRKAPAPLTDTWTWGGVHCTAACVPPPTTWTLKDFYSPGSGNTELGWLIDEALTAHGVEGPVYAPTVTKMNAEVGSPEDMTLKIPLISGRSVYRNKENPLDLLAFGRMQLISKPRTVLMSGGGCGLAVATARGRSVAGHISRDGMVDWSLVLTGIRGRKHESDYHAIARQFDVWQVPRSEIRVRNVFFIDPKAFDHPFDDLKYGDRNRTLYNFLFNRFGAQVMKHGNGNGQLSLPALCRVIGDELGFDRVKSTCILPPAGGFGHTRNPDPLLKEGRNLAFVTMRAT
jgi:hypothetical protein